MSTGHTFPRRAITALLLTLACTAAMAATPAENLDSAGQLFTAGRYQECRDLLLSVQEGQLTPEQTARRSELLEEVDVAINQSDKARRDLQDGERALESNMLTPAEDFLKAVDANKYASSEQKDRARRGLGTVARKRELNRRAEAAPPASRPVEADRPAGPVSPAPDAPRPAAPAGELA